MVPTAGNAEEEVISAKKVESLPSSEIQLCYCHLCSWEGVAVSEENAAEVVRQHVLEKHTPRTYNRRFL